MKRAILTLAAVVAVAITLSAQNTPGANGLKNEKNILDYVVSPNSLVYNNTFSEWDARWQQWAYSIPVAKHPLFDNNNGDCSVGQSGPVWFLGGKFCGNGVPGCDVNNVQRTCTIPRGKMLYFPVYNGEDSVLEESVAENPGKVDKQQIGDMRLHYDAWVVPVTSYAIIDGVRVPHLENYRVNSTTFGFTIPDDNYLKAVYDPQYASGFPAGTYFPAVDYGEYLMLAPLPPGTHEIKFGAHFPDGDWGFNITYLITVPK